MAMKAVGDRKELIGLYLAFFRDRRAHRVCQNVPLVPQNDPTVLFTTAGMHPLVPFLLGQPHPLGKRLANVQKCIRTTDIDNVGDSTHLTFFEMLGNWSLGDYFKKDAIEYSFDFLTKSLGIPVEMLSVTCFSGDSDAPRDLEASGIWEKVGIPKEKIAFLPKEDNWWGPAGKSGPCGPDTEMFCWVGSGAPPEEASATDRSGWMEIWNDVFMQFNKSEDGSFSELAQKNVDTGMGVERTLAILQGKTDVFLTGCFSPIIGKLEELSGRMYSEGGETQKAMRIVSDHVKAAVFILSERAVPGRIGRGYVLRRIIRRAIRYARNLGIGSRFARKVAETVYPIYSDYEYLAENREFAMKELEEEEERFSSVIEQGMKYFEKVKRESLDRKIDGKTAFLLYQSFGFPIEITEELAKESGLSVDLAGYEAEASRHQELSRTASAGAFKAGLADSSAETTRLHTATHLLLAALRNVLGNQVEQRGSNITPERLRFDFSHGEKLSADQLRKVEEIVNGNISAALEVRREEMHPSEALASGAIGIFGEKYGEIVSVYSVVGKDGSFASREICSGPHVSNAGELGKFRIAKEEACAKGIRRIKAVLGPK
ncbi:MAG: alanine--tRNA ligase [archaeon]